MSRFTITVLAPGKAEGLLPSAQQWGELRQFSLKTLDAPVLAFGAYSLATLSFLHFCGDSKAFCCYVHPLFYFALERRCGVERHRMET